MSFATTHGIKDEKEGQMTEGGGDSWRERNNLKKRKMLIISDYEEHFYSKKEKKRKKRRTVFSKRRSTKHTLIHFKCFASLCFTPTSSPCSSHFLKQRLNVTNIIAACLLILDPLCCLLRITWVWWRHNPGWALPEDLEAAHWQHLLLMVC